MTISVYDKLQIELYLQENNLKELETYSQNRNIHDYILYFIIFNINKLGNSVKFLTFSGYNENIIESLYKKIKSNIINNFNNYSLYIILLIKLDLFPNFSIDTSECFIVKKKVISNSITYSDLDDIFDNKIKQIINKFKKDYEIDKNNSLFSYIKGMYYYKLFRKILTLMNATVINENTEEKIILTTKHKFNIKKNSLIIINKSQIELEKSFKLFSSTNNRYDSFLTKCDYSIPYLTIIYLFQYNSSYNNKKENEKSDYLGKMLYLASLSLLSLLDNTSLENTSLENTSLNKEFIIKNIFKIVYNKELDFKENNIIFNLYFNKEYFEDSSVISDEEFNSYITYFSISINKNAYIPSQIFQYAFCLKGYFLLYGYYNFEKNEKLGELMLKKMISIINNKGITNTPLQLLITKILDEYEIIKTSKYLISIKKRKINNLA